MIGPAGGAPIRGRLQDASVIRELLPPETGLAFEAMKALRTELTDEAAFAHRVDDVQRAEGYRLVAAFPDARRHGHGGALLAGWPRRTGTSLEDVRKRLGTEPGTLADFEAEHGPVRPPDGDQYLRRPESRRATVLAMESVQREITPSKNAAAEAEAVRLNRLREDAQRPMSVNLAETIALSHALLKMADPAQRR